MSAAGPAWRTLARTAGLLAALLWVGPVGAGCRLEPLPYRNPKTVLVARVAELQRALARANHEGHVTLLLEDGTYRLGRPLRVLGPGIEIRSRSGARERVVIRGAGMRGPPGFVFWVKGAEFVAADLTIGWVKDHAIQIKGESGATRPLLHNLHVVDVGTQMIKITGHDADGQRSEGGIVEHSLFEFSTGRASQWYTGGVDGLYARDWVVRFNEFRAIRSPEQRMAGPAILFWGWSRGTRVEGNRIIDSDRGIQFGLSKHGHRGGLIRNNMVQSARDVGIGVEHSPGTRIEHNTVDSTAYPNSIEYRFADTTGVRIANNLVTGRIARRDGAEARLEGNVTGADRAWFVDAARGDLHLAVGVKGVVDAARPVEGLTRDIDCKARPVGLRPDVGAEEHPGVVETAYAVPEPSWLDGQWAAISERARSLAGRAARTLRDPERLAFLGAAVVLLDTVLLIAALVALCRLARRVRSLEDAS